MMKKLISIISKPLVLLCLITLMSFTETTTTTPLKADTTPAFFAPEDLLPAALLPPAAPTLGYYTVSSNSIKLVWTEPLFAVDGYHMYIYINGGTGVLASFYTTENEWVFANASGTFGFAVAAYNSTGESALSNKIVVTLPFTWE